MASIRFFSAFNMVAAQDWDWSVTEHTAASLVIQDIGAGKKQTFAGTFSYDSLGNVSGNVTGTAFYENGDIVYRVTGLNHDAGTMQAFAETSGDTQETYAFVLSGNDVVTGSDAADTLAGYGGNDKINGGAGRDGMLGGAGNDSYVVDNALDKVYETTTRSSGVDAGGMDVVKAYVSFTLSQFVEKLILTGTAAINGTGNAGDNAIIGNGAANTLAGGGGADLLISGDGDDVLRGGSGRDTTGGEGEDTFDFNLDTDSGATRTTWDTVKDFANGLDKIDLSTIDANALEDGNQAFMYAGSGSWGAGAAGAGVLRCVVMAAGVVLYGNTDADIDPEFAIFLTGANFVEAADLVL
ncbi:M10 family metallopeptidase C-terminal domain-containing protein [Ramlibacter sp. PS3R-8]|uniref:calcium-binding protein n=1 Tax=Ramlibacter sp. PS3R-8 TaxID=3133437 RepID=UPI0030A84067